MNGIRGDARAAAAALIERLAAEGMSDKEIAARLSLSHRVVGHIRQGLRIEAGGAPAARRPVSQSCARRDGDTADCPVCDVECPIDGGRFADHGSCAGSGLRVGEAA